MSRKGRKPTRAEVTFALRLARLGARVQRLEQQRARTVELALVPVRPTSHGVTWGRDQLGQFAGAAAAPTTPAFRRAYGGSGERRQSPQAAKVLEQMQTRDAIVAALLRDRR